MKKDDLALFNSLRGDVAPFRRPHGHLRYEVVGGDVHHSARTMLRRFVPGVGLERAHLGKDIVRFNSHDQIAEVLAANLGDIDRRRMLNSGTWKLWRIRRTGD